MQSKVVRQCGTIEHWSTSRHAIGIYTAIANCCRYVVSDSHLSYDSAQSLVEVALARMIVRMAGLRVGITKEHTNQASFVSVPSMDLRDFIEWETVKEGSQAQFDARVLDVTKTRLEQLWQDVATRPPWRLLVVQNCTKDWGQLRLDMVFVTHHALSDGKSTMVFHTELLRELNYCPTDSGSGPPAELKNHVLSFDRAPVLAPPQQELVKFRIGWVFFLKTLWQEFAPSWLKPTPPVEPWTGKAITLEPHKLNLRLIPIDKEVVPKLVTACRSHGATFTAIIHVLVLISVAKRVPAQAAAAFSSDTPISLIPWAELPPGSEIEDITRVLSVLTTSSSKVWDAETVADLRRRLSEQDQGLEEGLMWPLAATWRVEMKKKLASLPNDDVCGLMDYVTDWQKWWEGKIGKRRGATWEVSNIGLISPESAGHSSLAVWDIRRSFFTQPAFLAGPGFAINVTGVERGEATMTLNWQGGVIEDAMIDGVVEDLTRWLETFQVNGSFGIVENKKSVS
ncbi:hypothetical protein KVR01_004974 [Diaporthe batatas]|uniref:uncharacterized protein n=1 Tax=Diaporthe batatas TaxID=748121 RepID=UPI001D05B54A|nr:uncharacterized protein KVR01_004974 [Diaporthe batatas]KAG8164699.1 hypothetical protein KVR01_004974 [Diaporthe batatas]